MTTIEKYFLIFFAVIIVALVLGSCSFSSKIDEATGTTLAQRCADYRVAYTSAEIFLQASQDRGASAEEIARRQLELDLVGAQLARCPSLTNGASNG